MPLFIFFFLECTEMGIITVNSQHKNQSPIRGVVCAYVIANVLAEVSVNALLVEVLCGDLRQELTHVGVLHTRDVFRGRLPDVVQNVQQCN